MTKAEKALEDIKSSSGSQNVEIYNLDLASFKSVRHCASEVIKKEPRLDILINNAGSQELFVYQLLSKCYKSTHLLMN